MIRPADSAVRSTMNLEPKLHQVLRLKAAHSRRSMSEIVNDVLREDEEDLAAVRQRAREITELRAVPDQAEGRWHALSSGSSPR